MRTNVVQRIKYGLGNSVKPQVGEEGNGQRCQDDDAKYNSDDVHPVIEQKIPYLKTKVIHEPRKSLPLCRESRIEIVDLLYCHNILP